MPEQPIMAFATGAAFRKWLKEHHATHPGIWLQLAKRGSGIDSVTYAAAVEVALCFGWIDGQVKKFDAQYWLQRFTRRGPRSVWSKINVGRVEQLIRDKRMMPAGLAAVDAAKSDGRWDAAYHGSRVAEMPADFLAALEQKPKAKAFFATLNKTNRYPFYFRVATARKPETRARLIADFVALLNQGGKLR